MFLVVMVTSVSITAWKVSVFRFFLLLIFLHSGWIRRDTPYLSIFSPNVEKCGPEKLRVRRIFTFHAVQNSILMFPNSIHLKSIKPYGICRKLAGMEIMRITNYYMQICSVITDGSFPYKHCIIYCWRLYLGRTDYTNKISNIFPDKETYLEPCKISTIEHFHKSK